MFSNCSEELKNEFRKKFTSLKEIAFNDAKEEESLDYDDSEDDEDNEESDINNDED